LTLMKSKKSFRVHPAVLLAGLMIAILICLFLLKSSETDCKSHSIEGCPASCVVCPPCLVCSSISCQTEEFCNSVGFGKSWYATAKEGENFTCYLDSDCVIKDNGVNCPRGFHKDDTSKYEPSIPPSETDCPKVELIMAICSQGKCDIKYDCSKCDALKDELGEFCSTHADGTSGWICKMYSDCNC